MSRASREKRHIRPVRVCHKRGRTRPDWWDLRRPFPLVLSLVEAAVPARAVCALNPSRSTTSPSTRSRVANSAASCKLLGTRVPPVYQVSTPQRLKRAFPRPSPLPFFFFSRASPIAPFRCRAPSLRMHRRRSPIGSPRYLSHDGGGLVVFNGVRSVAAAGRVV